MGIIAWIVVGIIAGWLAKFVVPGTGPGGVLGDLIIGVIGAILGGWIWNYFGHVGATGINIPSLVVAFIGSIILLFIVRAMTRSTARA
ncbi:MAG TPA: GlsB/YeaQ/YmgE family stress response membrane protein [Candidatus Eremiobacteraceae bacterium]|nr:GlsB/YeaQ/YmgE family stress response membrane protein [Candidatus Eremiobacteraceae bacterium]